MLVSPEMRTTLFKDVVRSGKSGFVGFLLWCATIFPPKEFRDHLENMLTRLRNSIQGFDDKIKALQEQGTVALASQGKKIDFTGIDLTNLRRISFQDIQNLQSLAQWDILVCSLEFQEIMAVAETNPMFRLMMELLNVPTTPEDKYKKCGAPPYLPINQKVQKATTPVIVDTEIKDLVETPEAAEAAPEEVAEAPEEGAPVEEGAPEEDAPEEGAPESAKGETPAIEEADDTAPVPAPASASEDVAKPATTPEPVVEAHPAPAPEVPHETHPAPAPEPVVQVHATPGPVPSPATPPSKPTSFFSKMKLPWKGGSKETKKARKTMRLKKTKSIRNRKSTPRRVSRRLPAQEQQQ
jgi:hypothetical protein